MYIIEGNIGAGKTTFLNIIGKQLPHITIVDEPLNSWHYPEHGQSLLENFYKDTPRWAFTMEMFTLMCRIQEHTRTQSKNSNATIMERSIYSGYYCFALNSYEQGFMNDLEWEIHKRWFDYLVQGKCENPNGFIYLKVSPEVAYKRTKKRNRSGEESISLAYFQQIHNKLEQFLTQKKNLLHGLETIPVLEIDCNQEFCNDKTRQQQMLAAVKKFVGQPNLFIPARKETAHTEKNM